MSCRGLGASGLGRTCQRMDRFQKLSEFEPSEAHRTMVDENQIFRQSLAGRGRIVIRRIDDKCHPRLQTG